MIQVPDMVHTYNSWEEEEKNCHRAFFYCSGEVISQFSLPVKKTHTGGEQKYCRTINRNKEKDVHNNLIAVKLPVTCNIHGLYYIVAEYEQNNE